VSDDGDPAGAARILELVVHALPGSPEIRGNNCDITRAENAAVADVAGPGLDCRPDAGVGVLRASARAERHVWLRPGPKACRDRDPLRAAGR